jgi:hypothetical protein
VAKKCGQRCNFQKNLLKVNSYPMGKASPNLVTLLLEFAIEWFDYLND